MAGTNSKVTLQLNTCHKLFVSQRKENPRTTLKKKEGRKSKERMFDEY